MVHDFGKVFVVEVTSYAGPDEPSVDVLAQFGRQGDDALQVEKNSKSRGDEHVFPGLGPDHETG